MDRTKGPVLAENEGEVSPEVGTAQGCGFGIAADGQQEFGLGRSAGLAGAGVQKPPSSADRRISCAAGLIAASARAQVHVDRASVQVDGFAKAARVNHGQTSDPVADAAG